MQIKTFKKSLELILLPYDLEEKNKIIPSFSVPFVALVLFALLGFILSCIALPCAALLCPATLHHLALSFLVLRCSDSACPAPAFRCATLLRQAPTCAALPCLELPSNFTVFIELSFALTCRSMQYPALPWLEIEGQRFIWEKGTQKSVTHLFSKYGAN